jgi:hypothetical protein
VNAELPKLESGLQPKPRRWAWLRWFLLMMLVLALLLAAVHRPLLRWLVDYAGRKAASSQGIGLQWEVDGSVLGDLRLRGVRADGGAAGPLRKLTASHASAEYSVWRAIREGPGSAVSALRLADAEVELDLRKPAPEAAKKEPGKRGPLPQIKLPLVVLERVTATVRLPDGDVIVQGLDLELRPDAVGNFALGELRLPGGKLPDLRNLKGQTRASDHAVAIESLKGIPGIATADVVASLHPPGGGAWEAAVRAELEGSGRLEASVKAGPVNGSPLSATVSATGLRESSLAAWLPQEWPVTWQVDRLEGSLSGLGGPLNGLEGNWQLQGGPVQYEGVVIERVGATAAASAGKWQAEISELATGTNRLRATASGSLPESPAGFRDAAVDGAVNFEFPEAAGWFAPEMAERIPFRGQLKGQGDFRVDGGRLAGASLDLEGNRLVAAGVPVASLRAKATTEGEELKLTECRASFDNRNAVEMTGTLGLKEQQPVSLQWKAMLPDLARLSTFTGRPGLPGPDGGSLTGSGTVAGNLADWKLHDFAASKAHSVLVARSVRWKGASVESLDLEARVHDNLVECERGVVVLDARNRLTITGRGGLREPHDFQAMVDGDLKQVRGLNAWLAAFGQKPLRDGSAALQWQGKGTVRPWSVQGGGQVKVNGLALEGMKDALSAEVQAKHEGESAAFPILSAKFGDLELKAPARMAPDRLTIPALTMRYRGLPAVEGNLEVPLDFSTKGPAGPVAMDRPMNVALAVKALDLKAVMASLGRKSGAVGKADASLTVRGSLRAPDASFRLTAAGLSCPAAARQLKPAAATVEANLRNGRLSLRGDARQAPLEVLTVSGGMPLDPEALLQDPAGISRLPLDFQISLPDSSLAALRPLVPALTKIEGKAGLRAKVGGTVERPEVTGEFHAMAPSVAFTKADVPDARDVKLRLRFAGTRVIIEEAGAMLAGGTVGAQGNVDWQDPANPGINVQLRAKEALVLRDDSISLRADADVRCAGTLRKADVTGKIELVRGRVFKEIEFLPLSLPDQLPPAPPAVTMGKKDPPALPPPFDQWNLAVDIVTRDPIRLLGNVLNGGVVSQLKLSGTGARPVLVGKVSLQDARVRLPFSRLAVSRGDLLFTADKPFNPTLDVIGDSFVNGYQVQVQGYGEALNPKVRFSSSPPLPEGEIATLLATGSTSEGIQGGQGEAANRAAFLVISQMYRKMFRKGMAPRESDRAPRLSFSFSPLNNAGGSRSISAVYEVGKNLEAIGTVNQSGSFRGLLYYLIRFR